MPPQFWVLNGKISELNEDENQALVSGDQNSYLTNLASEFLLLKISSSQKPLKILEVSPKRSSRKKHTTANDCFRWVVSIVLLCQDAGPVLPRVAAGLFAYIMVSNFECYGISVFAHPSSCFLMEETMKGYGYMFIGIYNIPATGTKKR
ncbi:hypothetical protein STEG23_012215 [Scotinomys teguina]